MLRTYIVILSLILVAPIHSFAQSISGISGSLSHGSTIVINGSSFGTKPSAPPLKWEDFERGTNNTDITTADGWDDVGGDPTSKPRYSTAAKHSGLQGMIGRFLAGSTLSNVRLNGNFAGGFYLDAWYRYAPANPPSRNYKMFLLYGSNNDVPQVHFAGFCDLSGSMVFDVRTAAGTGTMGYSSASFNNIIGGELKHLQVWLQPGTSGGNDGIIWAVLNGGEILNKRDVLAYEGGGTWNHLRLGYYMGKDEVSWQGQVICPASPGDSYVYWDDVYIDNTPARIELGNASTYSASTHREIQIPTAWGSNQISAKVNMGTFQSGTPLYVFVTDSSGRTSPGFLASSGGPTPTPDTLAPAPPTNLSTN